MNSRPVHNSDGTPIDSIAHFGVPPIAAMSERETARALCPRDLGRGPLEAEIYVFDEHIRRHDQVGLRVFRHYGAIVADALQTVFLLNVSDELELRTHTNLLTQIY